MDVTQTRIKSKAPLPVIIGVAVLVLGLIGLSVVAYNLAGQQGARPTVGSVAPEFELAMYDNYNAGLGQKVKLSDLKGKVVVVNFWASWCIPCKDEAPAIQAVANKYAGQDVVILGVNYLDVETEALGFLATYGISYPNGIDLQQKVARAFRITGVPETFVIDAKGIVRASVIQPVNEATLTEMIERARK